jgi:thioredoxin reductase (NADPH)
VILRAALWLARANTMESEPLDCAIIGGGPAGLTAALYLARFNRSFALFDAGDSRAAWIPESHNLPLFTHGIAGREILRRQREGVQAYDSTIIDTEAKKIIKAGSGFTVEFQKGGEEPSQLTARFVILATGVEDIPPLIPNLEEAVQRGLVRYCPICDGYEANGKKIGVIGVCDKGLGEAVFMARAYSPDVTLLSFHEPLVLSDQELGMAKEHGISVICEPIQTLGLDGRAVTARASKSGREYRFDMMYSALGVRYRSGLAIALGAETDDMGALLIDCHSQTTVPGLYAAGDVTQGLNQIVVAMGEAAKAATRIHNSL